MNYFLQQTERTNLRKLKESDIGHWVNFFVDNSHLPYLGIANTIDDKNFDHLELSKKWINKQFVRYKDTGFGLLAVELKSTGELIAQSGILQKEIDGEICYEIAYSLMPKYWRQGFASEVSATLVDFAIENEISNKLISIIHVDNIGSQKVAEKNKMEVIKKSYYMNMDVFIYGRAI